MFLVQSHMTSSLTCLLHACGDVSGYFRLGMHAYTSAPRMWRCFCIKGLWSSRRGVCSTHVEMFPYQDLPRFHLRRLLHACGDVSAAKASEDKAKASAPRMWRCFHTPLRPVHLQGVCSTHVEMFLALIACVSYDTCLLHACGDVSIWLQWTSRRTMSAPRMWRCFRRGQPGLDTGHVCSTHVEMFHFLL